MRGATAATQILRLAYIAYLSITVNTVNIVFLPHGRELLIRGLLNLVDLKLSGRITLRSALEAPLEVSADKPCSRLGADL